MILGVEEINLGWFLALVTIELVIGFLIGFIILAKAFKWALISAIVIGALTYFGFVTFKLDGIAEVVSSSGIKSLLMFISLPLAIGVIIGFVVRKFF